MTRRVLGRGLSALLSESPQTSSEQMLELNINQIEPNSEQPRTRFVEAKLAELAQSIKANGIVQPLLVRRHNGGKYQIVAGERRWRAAQIAGIDRVPVIVRDISDDKMLELALIENIQRQELNPIEEAQAYKRLIEHLNVTQESIAQRVGRDRTFITNYLRLLRLPREVQQMVEEEQLSMGHARALLGVEDPEQQTRIAKSVVERNLTVRETERLMKTITTGTEQKGNADEKATIKHTDPNIQAAEDKLRRRFGTRVKVLQNSSGKGKIEIEFYNQNDLNRIYEILSQSNQS